MPDDAPGRSTRRNNLSRRTVVIRRAKDEDARRIAERDAAGGDAGRALGTACSLTRRGKIFAARVPADTPAHFGRERAATLRPAERRAGSRRRALVFYAAGYFLLFGCHLYVVCTGKTAITPAEFVEKSFARAKSTDITDLENAARAAMRGNRTPAELHLAQAVSFRDENGDTVRVEAGNRLTLPAAARLARAVIEDGAKPERLRVFTQPIAIYRETHLAGLNWPVYLSLYNAFGFFLLLWLFLRRPLLLALGTEGKKTAAALRNARSALEEAEAYKQKYRALSVEVAERTEALRAAAKERARAEREEALADAARQAEAISLGVRSALEGEERERAEAMGRDAAMRACDGALEIVRGRLGDDDHDLLVEELITRLAAMPREAI